jgi:hypothetical protein
VLPVFQEAFRSRHREVSAAVVESVAAALQIQPEDAREVRARRDRAVRLCSPVQMFATVRRVIDEALFESMEPGQIAALFPKKFNKDLKELIAAIVAENLPSWRDEATRSMVCEW